MITPENFRRTEDGAKPSESLNHAFTYVVQRFDDKVRASGGFDELPEVAGAVPSAQITEEGGFLLDPYEHRPDIYNNKEKFYRKPTWISGVNLAAPIGEYGSKWAQRLIVATDTLIDAAISHSSPLNISDELERVGNHFEEDLDNFTYRRSSKKNKRGPEAAFTEGFQSTLFALGFLTAYKVEGFEDDPEGLVEYLIDKGVVSRLARFMPPHETATMGDRNVLFENPVVEENTGVGRIDLRKDIVHFLANHDERGMRSAGAINKLNMPGCPVGRLVPGESVTGVDLSAKLILDTVVAQKDFF